MTKGPDIKIYSFYYKPGKIIISDDLYQPIMAGNSNINSQIIPGDDSGENISEKNPWFSELTGIYWVWKNTCNDIIGSCHYRRYFTAKPEPLLYKLKRFLYYPIGIYNKRHGLIYTNKYDFFIPHVLNSDEATRLLQGYDAILPQARKLKYTVEKHYQRYHTPADLKILKTIIAEKYPGFIESFNSVMEGKILYANNMFILKYDLFREFMTWWFDILFDFECRIELMNYNKYQKRVLGFIAERLLTVWFNYKKLKCIELQVIYFKKLKFQ